METSSHTEPLLCLQPHSNASLSFGPDQEQRFTRIGLYKGTLVALKAIHTRHSIDITRSVKLELKHVRIMLALGLCLFFRGWCVCVCGGGGRGGEGG